MIKFIQWLENQEVHSCVDCGRDMVGPAPRCLFCQSKLRKQGICVLCGEKPAKPSIGGRARSKYCADCQEIIKGVLTRDYSGPEKVHQPKRKLLYKKGLEREMEKEEMEKERQRIRQQGLGEF